MKYMTPSSNSSQCTHPTGRVLWEEYLMLDECFGKNNSSFLDFTRNYERKFCHLKVIEFGQLVLEILNNVHLTWHGSHFGRVTWTISSFYGCLIQSMLHMKFNFIGLLISEKNVLRATLAEWSKANHDLWGYIIIVIVFKLNTVKSV